LEIAPLPLALPAIQVSMIWHRQQDASPGLAWLRQCIAQAARELG
jgi:DNA-binding transcriptional LysR family regulator